MDSLPSSFKVNSLRSLSKKMKSSIKEPKLDDGFSNKLERKINPDYKAKPKFNLNKKLF